MGQQPRYDPLEASAFFADGSSARHLLPDTVARRQEPRETPFTTGKVNGQEVQTLPLPVTRELLEYGQERFNIYCSPCHGRAGTGRGMIVQRGYPRPPSFHTPRLREASLGHFFDVITNGFGAAMPEYGRIILPHDRWAIIAYIRTLQLSQYAPLAAVPENKRLLLQERQP
jgi:mono/diheme cytochrome c family protein